MPITMQEFNATIECSKKDSSHGLDQIDYKMLKNTSITFRAQLLRILNHILNQGTFPQEWHDFIIILLPKDSKKKFRPISLASCLLKIVEKIIGSRLQHYLEQKKIIPNTQYGFRKAKSCSLALSRLVTKINSAFNEKESVCGVMIDIKSAFDNVRPKSLKSILDKLKIPLNIKKFIYNLMTEKQLHFKIANNLEGPYNRNKGVPQCIKPNII